MMRFTILLVSVFLFSCISCFSLFSQSDNIEKKGIKNSGVVHDIEDEFDFTPVADRVKVLELIAKSSRGNYSKIKTMRGKYDFEDTTLYSKEYERVFKESLKIQLPSNSHITTKGEFEFIFNASPPKLFVDFRPLSVNVANNATDQEANNGSDTISIDSPKVLSVVTDESYMYVHPEKTYGVFSDFQNVEQELGKVVFVEEASKSLEQQEATVPDPACFFKIGPRFLWDEVDMLIAAINVEDKIKKEVAQFSIEVYEDTKNASVFKIVLTTGQKEEMMRRTIFIDGKNGFNTIKYYDRIIPKDDAKQSRFHVVSSLEYTSSAGVFIPSIIDLHYPNENGGIDRFVRRIQLQSIEINVRLSNDEFSYRKLGLSNGDRVRNNIKGELFFYKDGDLVKSLPKLYNHNSSRHLVFRVVMVTIGVVLIVIGVARKLAMSRRTQE